MTGEELAKYKKWEKLSTTQQHMILMYLYRVETEPMEELENYIETFRFRQYGIKRDDLPSFVQSLGGEKLKRFAYSVIGKQVEE